MFSLRNDPSRRKADADSNASQGVQAERALTPGLLGIGRVSDLYDDRAFRPIGAMAGVGVKG
ncbi:hypothetical protein USDA257_c36400 [Sinorhizobium fredii USDA 257]|uniref:Uncharacterized protein n=1 Tax=Sinorhizobium fredii (strain USDA 257) TaxID=1185652 RepID=I3X8I6_SINF2|nr:hypothetical protein USDA257_c36400 [Sinorhizobium fredii USDA 257]